jgi:hypothetical protein
LYEIGPDFELSPKVLEFEKICWNWNRKVLFTMGRTELKPTPKNLHYKKSKNKIKSKLTLKVLFKRKLHITHTCILER